MSAGWILWHGGPSYSSGYVADDAEPVASLAAAVELCRDREANRDGRTPCVEQSSAWFWSYDPRDVDDPYPDRVIEQGPRGGWRVTRA